MKYYVRKNLPSSSWICRSLLEDGDQLSFLDSEKENK